MGKLSQLNNSEIFKGNTWLITITYMTIIQSVLNLLVASVRYFFSNEINKNETRYILIVSLMISFIISELILFKVKKRSKNNKIKAKFSISYYAIISQLIFLFSFLIAILTTIVITTV